MAGATRSGRGWKAAPLDAIPTDWDIPLEGRVVPEDEAWTRIVARDPGAGERWTSFEERYPGIWDRFHGHAVRRYLGITAGGAAAFTSQAGDPAIVPRSEERYGYGQEELYVVVRGRVRFSCDGEGFELDAGDVAFVEPDVHREALALETPTMMLVVGAIPGCAYEPPFHLDASPGADAH